MRFALTTFGNPYDPFEQFTQWFMFDEEKGYHTTAYLGRIARTSDQLSALAHIERTQSKLKCNSMNISHGNKLTQIGRAHV